MQPASFEAELVTGERAWAWAGKAGNSNPRTVGEPTLQLMAG